MSEGSPISTDYESYDYEQMLADERRAKRIIGSMAISGPIMTAVATSEAIFDFTDYITTFVATGVAISGVLFTGSKIGYLHRINQASKQL